MSRDHVCILFNFIVTEIGQIDQIEKRNNKKGDYDQICKVLSEYQWNKFEEEPSIQELWDEFKDVISNCTEKFIPLYKSTNGSVKRKRWMTRGTLRLLKRRNQLWKKYRQSFSPEAFDN